MKRKLLFLCTILCVNVLAALAQSSNETLSDDGFTVVDNSFNPNAARDSLKASHKKVPQGMYIWSIDKRFGDITPQVRDTTQHLFMNTIFTTGRYGEYNTTGNLGSPRIARIATDRDFSPRDEFLEPYSFFITKPHELHFTNTLSPLTELFYSSCGNKTNGEDHLRAIFATNVNKKIGIGFKFNYVYGRGYYQNQSTALFDYTMWGSYIGERYQAHLIFSFDHMKNTENGGINNDDYVTHPEKTSESFSDNEIPVNLTSNWNRMNAFHLTFSHRYNIGFTRKVEMTEMEKEAKRFAMKSAAENEKNKEKNEEKDNSEGTKRRNEHNNSNTQQKKFSGRPDDAIIIGDLPQNKKNGKVELDSAALALVDSVAAQKNKQSNDTSWLKDEYVPVTSFIHNMQFDTNHRTYIAYKTPSSNYYAQRYNVPLQDALGDSIDDHTRYYTLKNTLAVALMEGLNKYVPMGLKLFISHDMRHYQLPDTNYGYTSYNEQNVSVGGQIIKTQGTKIHYKATAEFGIVGKDAGNILIDGEGDLNMRLFKDTAQVKLKAFYHFTTPTFLQRHYHSKYASWDNEDFSKQMQTHLEASFHLAKTKTTLRACYDNIQNLVYLANTYNATLKATSTGIDDKTITGYAVNQRQTSANISLITLALEQNVRWGILNWENRITFQKSSQQDILPVPTLNVWTNLYINFRIARVLRVHLGGEAYYFTKYTAPEYVPLLGQYAVQENSEVRTEVGGYPLVNVYANFCLKKCRFFVMMSHVNAGSGSKNYFLTPHHPLNVSVLRFGISWNFIN